MFSVLLVHSNIRIRENILLDWLESHVIMLLMFSLIVCRGTILYSFVETWERIRETLRMDWIWPRKLWKNSWKFLEFIRNLYMEIVFEKDISNLHILSLDTLFSMKFQIIFVLSLGFHSHVMQVPCEHEHRPQWTSRAKIQIYISWLAFSLRAPCLVWTSPAENLRLVRQRRPRGVLHRRLKLTSICFHGWTQEWRMLKLWLI